MNGHDNNVGEKPKPVQPKPVSLLSLAIKNAGLEQASPQANQQTSLVIEALAETPISREARQSITANSNATTVSSMSNQNPFGSETLDDRSSIGKLSCSPTSSKNYSWNSFGIVPKGSFSNSYTEPKDDKLLKR